MNGNVDVFQTDQISVIDHWGINDADMSSVFCIRCFSSVWSVKILNIFICTWVY